MNYGPFFIRIAAVACLLIASPSQAQELDPRRYVNLPVEQNFIALAYSHMEGDVNFSQSIPLTNAFLAIDAPALAYLRTFEMAGKSSSIDVQQPYVCLDGSAELDGETVMREVCGLADTRIRFSHNFFGAPAMAISEFGKSPKQFVAGFSIQVSVPVGDYDNTRLVNIGTNRWVIKPEIGATVPWKKWSLEIAAGVHFFMDNNDFLETSTFEQDPLFNLQLHAHYDFSRRQTLSVSSNYFFGGKTFRDGVQSAIRQEDSRLGVSWSYALNPQHIIKLMVNTGVTTRVANDSDQYMVAWSYRWD